MNSKEKIKKDKKVSNDNLFIFLKKNGLLLLLLFISIIVIFILSFYLITNWIGKRNFEKEAKNRKY